MLDLKFIRENAELVRKTLSAKPSKVDLDRLLVLDQERRTLLKEVETLKEERNQANDQISQLKREGKPVEAVLSSMKSSSQKIDEIDKKVGSIDKFIEDVSQKIFYERDRFSIEFAERLVIEQMLGKEEINLEQLLEQFKQEKLVKRIQTNLMTDER